MQQSQFFSAIRFAGLLSLTLGLAPFFPEPHILGKVKWLLGGAVGMQPMDWFDLFLHGTPWLVLIVLLVYGVLTNRFVKFRGKKN